MFGPNDRTERGSDFNDDNIDSHERNGNITEGFTTNIGASTTADATDTSSASTADTNTPSTTENDEFRLGGRLMYLLMLMRRGDAGMHRGGGQGDGHRGGRAGGRPGGARSQGRVLRLLSKSSPSSQKELAYLLGIRSQSLAELISKLEAAGLVTRRPDPNDRRTSLVDLTDAGRAAAVDISEETPNDPFAVLEAADQQQLAELLDKVIEGMEGQLPGGPDPRMQAFKDMAFGDGDPNGFPGFGGFGPGGPGRFGRGRSGGARRGGFPGDFDRDHRGHHDGHTHRGHRGHQGQWDQRGQFEGYEHHHGHPYSAR